MLNTERRFLLDKKYGFIIVDIKDGEFQWGRFCSGASVSSFDLHLKEHRDLIRQVLKNGNVVFGKRKKIRRI